MGPQNKNIANFSVFSCKSNSRITRIVSLSSNAYLYPFLPNDHHAIAQNAYLCPSLPNDHHAYQLSDLISRILSLFACLDLKDLMIRVCHSLMNVFKTENHCLALDNFKLQPTQDTFLATATTHRPKWEIV